MIEKLDVFATSRVLADEEVRGKVVVVIDVLRASSSIHTALENGACGVVPVSEKDDPSRFLKNMDASSTLLCGEKDGKKIEGFHLGNSPYEYSREVVEGKTLLFKTTNGTAAISGSTHATKLYIGSFLALTAVSRAIAESGVSEAVLVCAGWKGRVSLEDLMCAGGIAHALFGSKLPADAPDGVKVAYGLYTTFGSDVAGLVGSSDHARRLKSLGHVEDIAYCSRIDLFKSIPVYNDGIIRLEQS